MPERKVRITSDDRSPEINIVTWIMMVSMCCSVLIKVISNPRASIWMWMLSRDNVLMVTAMVVAIGQGIAVTEQVKLGGLGKRAKNLSDDEILSYQKAGFAAQLLYVLALCITKGTTNYLIATFSYTRLTRNLVHGLAGLTAAWGVVTMFAIAFQCPAPETWKILSPKCFNQPLFWDVIGTVDMLTDLGLALLPILILWNVQIAWSRKIPVMCAFSSRALVIPLAALRLVFIHSTADNDDQPFAAHSVAIATQIALNMAIILSCLPFLKTFMEQIQSTVFTPDVHMAANTAGAYGPGGSYGLESLGPSGKSGTHSNERKSKARSGARWFEDRSINLPAGATIATIVGNHDDRPLSSRSSGGSEVMIIRQTTTFAVVSEEAPIHARERI